MTRIAFACIAVLGAFIGASAFALQDDAASATSLKTAVENFNQKALRHSIGKTQPPLTEDEVVAAIRGWIPEHTPGVTDDVYDRFQEIAESRVLPYGAELSFCPSWRGYRGFRFEVSWIDLFIKTGEKAGYKFRIRDQKISSRKMTPDEIAEIETRGRDGSTK